jgi:hypothetical protein
LTAVTTLEPLEALLDLTLAEACDRWGGVISRNSIRARAAAFYAKAQELLRQGHTYLGLPEKGKPIAPQLVSAAQSW